MPSHGRVQPPPVRRSFATAVFVVCGGRVLLLRHRRYGRWLPPGGHLKRGELPDEAAVREVKEETGLEVCLVGRRGLAVERPRQLVVPEGVQVRVVAPGVEQVDIVYFARPAALGEPGELPTIVTNHEAAEAGWFGREELERMELTEEIRLWAEKALRTLG